jgi:biotin carboxylase
VAASQVEYPCVLKPLALSGSRGVIRADNSEEFIAAFERIRCLLERSEIQVLREESSNFLQVEKFIPGREVALEGILTGGKLKTLAVFDKPDPLDGPFFEETIYVTPTRLSAGEQESIQKATQEAVAALGLTHGPVHAELRLNPEGPWVLEIAARCIGGLCARVLLWKN